MADSIARWTKYRNLPKSVDLSERRGFQLVSAPHPHGAGVLHEHVFPQAATGLEKPCGGSLLPA